MPQILSRLSQTRLLGWFIEYRLDVWNEALLNAVERHGMRDLKRSPLTSEIVFPCFVGCLKSIEQPFEIVNQRWQAKFARFIVLQPVGHQMKLALVILYFRIFRHRLTRPVSLRTCLSLLNPV